MKLVAVLVALLFCTAGAFGQVLVSDSISTTSYLGGNLLTASGNYIHWDQPSLSVNQWDAYVSGVAEYIIECRIDSVLERGDDKVYRIENGKIVQIKKAKAQYPPTFLGFYEFLLAKNAKP